MSKVLGKAELLSGELLKRELVELPEWAVSVWMREMTGEHILDFQKRIKDMQSAGIKTTTAEQDVELMTLVVSQSICDEQGALLFTQEEAKQLTVNSVNLLTELFNKACQVSGIRQTENGQLTSEVADNLPNDLPTSSSENLPLSLDEPAERS